MSSPKPSPVAVTSPQVRRPRGPARLLPAAVAAGALAGLLAASSAGAQETASPAAPPAAPPAAAPADVRSMDAIRSALYDVISGPAGERDWNRFRSLFAPGARLIPTLPDSAGGATARILTVEDYVRRAGDFFRQSGFFEREIGRRTETFGNVAHVFSAYESRRAESDSLPFQRGVNSIQLLKDGDRWWVVTIFWDAERAGNPIPRDLLQGEG